MDIPCSKIVKSFLLYQNPLYAFSFPISLIIAIVVYGICVSMKCTSNSYMLQIIIPIITLILVNLFIDAIANVMIHPNEVNQLTSICLSHLSQRENFESQREESQEIQESQKKEIVQINTLSDSNDLRSPLPIIDNLYNDTFEVINQDPTQYSLPYNGMNSANFCKIA